MIQRPINGILVLSFTQQLQVSLLHSSQTEICLVPTVIFFSVDQGGHHLVHTSVVFFAGLFFGSEKYFAFAVSNTVCSSVVDALKRQVSEAEESFISSDVHTGTDTFTEL